MTTFTTKTHSEEKAAARNAVKDAKLELFAACVGYKIANGERADLLSGYHTEVEEYECDLACRAASAEKGRSRANLHEKIAHLKTLRSGSSSRSSRSTRHVLPIAA